MYTIKNGVLFTGRGQIRHLHLTACLINSNTNCAPAERGVVEIDESLTGPVGRIEYYDRERELELAVEREDGICRVKLPTLQGVGGCILFIHTDKI